MLTKGPPVCYDEHERLKPYEQMPFQYSLHKLSADGELEHFEFLHRENSNPVEELSKSLKETIGRKGTVLAWNDSFEKETLSQCNHSCQIE